MHDGFVCSYMLDVLSHVENTAFVGLLDNRALNVVGDMAMDAITPPDSTI
jgi:hypothetical protein